MLRRVRVRVLYPSNKFAKGRITSKYLHKYYVPKRKGNMRYWIKKEREQYLVRHHFVVAEIKRYRYVDLVYYIYGNTVPAVRRVAAWKKENVLSPSGKMRVRYTKLKNKVKKHSTTAIKAEVAFDLVITDISDETQLKEFFRDELLRIFPDVRCDQTYGIHVGCVQKAESDQSITQWDGTAKLLALGGVGLVVHNVSYPNAKLKDVIGYGAN